MSAGGKMRLAMFELPLRRGASLPDGCGGMPRGAARHGCTAADVLVAFDERLKEGFCAAVVAPERSAMLARTPAIGIAFSDMGRFADVCVL